MRLSHGLDRLDVAFDDPRLVADAGLLLPATLAHHLGLREHVETHVDLCAAAGRANSDLGTLYAPISREKAIEFAQKGLELAKRIGDLVHESWLYATLGGAYCSFTGDCSEGLAAAAQSVELDRRLGQIDHVAVPLILLGQIHRCHGQLEKSEAYFGEAVGFAGGGERPSTLVSLLRRFGYAAS